MGSLFICPRCGNSDNRYIGYVNARPYCRRCISFSGEEADLGGIGPRDAFLDLDYELSQDQTRLSLELIDHVASGNHVLIHAVTGAGKTEIVYPLIKKSVQEGKRVAIAIPRRDVVIELTRRLIHAFPRLSVIAVYGGHHAQLDGDIIVMTTHQLFRYDKRFDILIVDEYDAFPFKGDAVLEAFLWRSLKGNLVAMSATPSEAMLRMFAEPGYRVLNLWTRYHRHPLPVPNVVRGIWILRFIRLLRMMKAYAEEGKPLLVFVPTIACGEKLYRLLSIFHASGRHVNSKHEEREAIVEDFRKRKYEYLVTTSILERGITLENLQVIVYDADHAVFDKAMLLQMAGRVGRKTSAPSGAVIFLAKRKTAAMVGAIQETKDANTHL